MIWTLQRRHVGGRKWKTVAVRESVYPLPTPRSFEGTEQDAYVAAKAYVDFVTKRSDPDGEFRLKNRDNARTIAIPRAAK